uniref:Uncharacterized protein n=2 Tax=Timema TaxID=61471 RepID=A0A7R9DDV9_TIMPO|nr:unnamed protein product [Timema poppensis]
MSLKPPLRPTVSKPSPRVVSYLTDELLYGAHSSNNRDGITKGVGITEINTQEGGMHAALEMSIFFWPGLARDAALGSALAVVRMLFMWPDVLLFEARRLVGEIGCAETLTMLPLLLAVLRSYAPYITLPVAAVIGIIGYKVEGLVSDKYTPYERSSIEEKREERLLDENLSKDSIEVDSLKLKKFVPRTIFEKNVSPSLLSKN